MQHAAGAQFRHKQPHDALLHRLGQCRQIDLVEGHIGEAGSGREQQRFGDMHRPKTAGIARAPSRPRSQPFSTALGAKAG